jgi:hypothetical protein
MFFNTINEDVSTFKMAFFKLCYEKNDILAFFFNSFMKKIAETHIILWENAISAFFFNPFMKKSPKWYFFILFHGKMLFRHFFSIPL